MGNILDKNAVLDRVKQFYNLKGNADLARFLGVSPNTVTNWYSRKSLDIDAIYTNCVGCNFHWLLTGEYSMLRDSKNPEESKLGVTPNATPISPAEESIIYKMYKDEKEEKERMLKEKDAENKHLQSELRALTAELAAMKAQHPQSQNKESDHHTKISEVIENFTSDSYGDYGEGYPLTKKPTSSERSSAGKM